jgi:hypothetical protein
MQCPFCKEEIQDGAIKCKHCQTMLNGSSNSNPLLNQLFPFTKWLLIGIFALSILAFFFTNVSITVPIIGKMNYSMYDVVKKIGVSNQQQSNISDETKEKKPNLPDMLKKFGEPDEGDSKNKGGSIALIFFTLSIFGLALHYLFTIIWGVCTFVIHKTFRLLNITWLALAVQFPIVFAIGGQIIISDLKSEVANKGGADNPFAQLGAAIMDSFSIDPGIIMWILMIVAIIGLAVQFIYKGKIVESGVKEDEEIKEQTPMQKKKLITIGAIAGAVILIAFALKIFGLIPGGDSGLNTNRVSHKSKVLSKSIVVVEDMALSGRIKKESANIYIMIANGASYLLSTNFNSPQRKAIDASVKSGVEATVIGYLSRIKYGPDTNQFVVTPAGHKVFEVKNVLSAKNSGITKGVFKTLQCGDACYLVFEDSKGTEETYFASGGMSNFEEMATNTSLKGKKIKVYWEQVKKDRVAVLVVFLGWFNFAD